MLVSELYAAVVKEANEPVPMVQAVADGFGDDGLARDMRELIFQPGFESQHIRHKSHKVDSVLSIKLSIRYPPIIDQNIAADFHPSACNS